MNKKIILVLCVAVVAGFMIYCGQKEEKDLPTVDTLGEGKTDGYESEQQLSEYAELIVRVTKKEEKNIIVKDGMGGVSYGYTRSKVKIEEIYKNESGEKVNINDAITVYESQFTYVDKEAKKNVICHINGYLNMQEGKEYILYLMYSEGDQWFCPVAGAYGKIPVALEEDILVREEKLKNLNGSIVVNTRDEFLAELKKIQEDALKRYHH